MPGEGAIGTKYTTASTFSENISNAATGLSSFNAGTVSGGNASPITSANAAITELSQLLESAGSIITRDAGKILQVNCELVEADRIATIRASVEERMPLDISQQQ